MSCQLRLPKGPPITVEEVIEDLQALVKANPGSEKLIVQVMCMTCHKREDYPGAVGCVEADTGKRMLLLLVNQE